MFHLWWMHFVELCSGRFDLAGLTSAFFVVVSRRRTRTTAPTWRGRHQLAAAVEGTNAVALAALAPVPPPPLPPCLPRRRIADTVVRAMRSSPPIFVLASSASPPSSSKLRPPVHVAGERFTLAACRGARPFYGSWVEFVSATAATAAGPAVEEETAQPGGVGLIGMRGD
uniref:Uncharacterized protein n=1 Tax=Leersia perrieri TaxID=77586 RepID=A0A0D9UZX3_9ORYZ